MGCSTGCAAASCYSTTVAWRPSPACRWPSLAATLPPTTRLRWITSRGLKAVQGVKALHSGYSLETLRAALDEAFQHPGLSLIHIPVYYGENELGGMGVFGRWNVGNWSEDTQALRHRIGL